MENLEIQTKQQAAIQPTVNPMSLVEVAVKKGASIEQIQQLMDLRDRWEAGEARKHFVAAMAAFKSESIRILKDKDNNQYGSKYVSLGNLVTTVTPFLSKHGLSVRWDIEQGTGITVTCIITHSSGHSEVVKMTCPPDKSGAKNPIQEIKSAITYAKACTFESICGLASTDANVDDDGNGAGGSHMDAGTLDEWIDAMRQAEDRKSLQSLFTDAYKAAQAVQDRNAMKQLIAVKDKRKADLNG